MGNDIGNAAGSVGIPCKDFNNGCRCGQCERASNMHDNFSRDGAVTKFFEDKIPAGGLVTSAFHAAAGNKGHAERAAAKGAISTAGFALGGIAGAILAEPGALAVENVMLGIEGPKDMDGHRRIPFSKLEDEVPSFPTYLNKTSLQNAIDGSKGGKVVTGGSCAGVAMQRVWWLTYNKIRSSNWEDAPMPCIASHLEIRLQDDGFRTYDLGCSWSKICNSLDKGHIVLCIIRNLHWVTLIGVEDELAYVIDYKNLFTVPEAEFKKHVMNIKIYAPSGAIAVHRRK